MISSHGSGSLRDCLLRLRVAKAYDGLLRDLKTGTKVVTAEGIWGPPPG